MTREEILSDPLYREVLQAQTKEEAQRKLNTLKSIRGTDAVQHLIEYIKDLKARKGI